MNKYSLIFIFLLIGGIVSAQDRDSLSVENTVPKTGNTLIKINLLSLPLKNFSFGLEHKIGRKITAGIGYRFMPNGGLPLMSTITDLVDDPETSKQFEQIETSNMAITPEIRFYLGKQVMRGFYLAPFARYSSYKASLPFEFDVNGTMQTMPLSGTLNTLTGGLLIGAQWKLGGRVYLDWWMLGPQYGSADGSLDGKRALSANEQQELRTELQNLEIPFAETTTTVDANGARLDIKGPWAGLRTGLNLGIRF